MHLAIRLAAPAALAQGYLLPGSLRYARGVRVPAEAGDVVVDLRPIGRLPIPRVVRWVLAVLGILLVIGIVTGDPDGWKPLALFVAPVIAVTWLLLHARRQAQLVCERGLIVRNFVRRTFIAWPEVRGLRARGRSYKGAPYTEYLVHAGGRPIVLPGPASRRRDLELEQRGLAEIQARAGVELAREPRRAQR